MPHLGDDDARAARYRPVMSVAPEEIAQVRAATDIVALLGEHVALRKTGQRWTGLCPFHEEKTPSFSVNAEEGLYYCFGCQASGDAITFVRETQHLDFIDAIRQLAERAGIQLHEDRDAGSGGWRDKSVLYDAVERAVAWYHERLLSAADAGRARDYLRSRGYDADTVREFRLGWAPDDWDQLVRALAAARRGGVDRGTRVREQGRSAPRRPAREGALPDPRSWRSPDRDRRADPAVARRRGARPRGASSRSTRTPRRRRSTRSAGRSTGSTGRSRTSSPPARSSCARATPTSSRSSAPGSAARSRRAAPPSPRTTSG